MSHDATTIATVVPQTAARPGAVTHRLDVVNEANTIAFGTPIPLGAGKRGKTGRAKGVKDKEEPPIENLRTALTLWVTTNIEGTLYGDKKSQQVAGATHGIGENDLRRMARKLPRAAAGDFGPRVD